jgi:hypothetical protein
MDRDKLSNRRKSESGFALLVVVAIFAIAVGTFCLMAARNAFHTFQLSRENVIATEMEARSAQVTDMSKADTVVTVANELAKFAQGQNPTSLVRSNLPAFLRTNLHNFTGAGGTGSSWSNASGITTTWQSLAVPTGSRKLFGNRTTFVGRILYTRYLEQHSGSDNAVNLSKTKAANKEVRLYEFPANTFAAAGDRVYINGSSVNGNVLAGWLEMRGANAQVAGAASVYRRLSTDANARINGITLASLDAAAGPKLAKRVEAGYYGSAALNGQVSVFRGTEEEALVILSDMTRNGEGIPQMFRKVEGRSPTAFECYFLPAYQCRIRVSAQLVADAAQPGGYRATVSIYNASVSNLPASLATETLAQTFNLSANGGATKGFSLAYSSVGTPNWYIAFDPAEGHDAGLNLGSIYIDFKNQSGARTSNHFVVLKSYSPTLGNVSSFSLVTPNLLKLTGTLNQNNKPMSIFAPEVRFGVDAAPASVVLSGQRGTLDPTGALAVDTVKSFDGTNISAAAKTVNLTDITSPSAVPPVNVLAWMLLVRNASN